MFGTDLKAFFEEQKGGIRVGQVEAVSGKVALGTDGYVCLGAGVEDFSIPIDNPLGYELRVESSFTQTYGGIDGVTASAAGKDSLVVSLPPGQTPGNEGVLHIKVMTAKEGRILYEGDIGIAYLDFTDFTAHLGVELFPSLALAPPFDPELPNYSISNAPDLFSIRVVAVADPDDIGPFSPLITIDGVSGQGVLVRNITPADGGSTVLMRVELPHGAAGKNYSFVAHYSTAALVVQQAPGKTVYQAGDPLTAAGLIADGLEMNYVTGEGVSPVDLTQCDIDCESDEPGLQAAFTTPGTKVVTVSYTDPGTGFTVKGAFTVYVVGLSALDITGPGGYTAAVAHDAPGAYTLATVFAVDRLNITATSAVEGASLNVTRTYPSVEGGVAVSGTAKTIPLAVGSNTITIEVKLDRGSGGVASETWTINITRASIGVSEYYVAETGGSDTAGGGTQALPFATIKYALDLIQASGLGGVLDAKVTIFVSGTLTADTGTNNGMVDISGSGYPEIILKGIGAGTNVIDAAGKYKRVLYIGGGAKVTLGDNLTLTGGAATGTYGYGGGVLVSGDSAFTMSGGVIEGNTASSGGGVSVTGFGSTFTMGGNAVIKDNSATSGGGGVYVVYGTFAMNENAVIKDNSAISAGSGVSVFDGTFAMNENAVIEGNSNYGGAGVYVTGITGSTFTMGGTAVIQNNTITMSGSGSGGVSVTGSGSTFTMGGSAVIKGHNASWGGGVSVSDGTFTMKENAVIEGNDASYGFGGGVSVEGAAGVFTMGGNAVIKGNYAGFGGGVCVVYGTFTMKENAVIEGNDASFGGFGGGVYVDSGSGSNTPTFSKTGGTIYGAGAGPLSNIDSSGGNAVHLSGGKYRNSTVGTDAEGNLYAKYSIGSGSWNYVDPASGGLGNTEENWDLP
jgi:hypothetical protein